MPRNPPVFHRPDLPGRRDERASSARGYTSAWRRASKLFLIEHPLCTCERCARRIVPLPANVVDHRVPHRGDSVLFWDRSNWRAMNKRCHDRKTVHENRGAHGQIEAHPWRTRR